MELIKICVYILECSDGSLYTGYTTNILNRIKKHNSKKGAKYTRNRTPVLLKYYENFDNKKDAMKKEYIIKKLSKKEKYNYIKENINQEKIKIINEINNYNKE